MTVRAPHALVAAVCFGIAAANAARVTSLLVAAAAAALVSAGALAPGEQRFIFLAAGLALAGWWWGGTRLDAIDASVLDRHVGTAARAVLEVTAPARRSRYRLRIAVGVRRFGATVVREPALLELPPGRAPPQGALVSAVVVVEQPRGPEDGFDERAWLAHKGVHVVLRASRWTRVGARGGLGGFADRLRARVARPLLRGADADRGALLTGVVLGDDQAVDKDLRDRFRASGLYHLLAVSGQNIALVAAGALILVRLLGASRLIGQFAALASIFAYVLAVGPSPSVLRAGVVGALGSIAWLAARQRDRWHFLLLAALVLLAWNPYSLADAGFQLSFAAVAAIFLLVRPILRVLEGYPLPSLLDEALAVSTACGLVTAPILWFQFHALPLFAVPANALAAPAVPPLLALALTAALVDPVLPGVASVLAWLAGWCAAWLALCARVVGGAPFAQVTTTRGALALVAVFGAGGGAYAWRRWPSSSRST